MIESTSSVSLTRETVGEGHHSHVMALADEDQHESDGQDGVEQDDWTSYLSGWRLQILTFACVVLSPISSKEKNLTGPKFMSGTVLVVARDHHREHVISRHRR